MINTDVLIIGSGPAGSSCAALLSSYGIDNIVVTKQKWFADTPRAHITNQRAMEVFRDLGIEDDVNRVATPQELMGNNVFCESLSGEELGRLYSWGNHPNRMADYTLSSPTRICDCPQNLLEPILAGHAAANGTEIRFYTEYLTHQQDDENIVATVKDRESGEEYQIQAKYLIGADGGNSKVVQNTGIPIEGKMGVAGSMNIIFHADLSRYVAHRPSVLYWILQPGSDVGGIGMGLVRMVRPWNEWLIVWGYDINEPPPQVSEKMAIKIAHNLVGDDTLPIKIRSTSLWTNNHAYASYNTVGRVFCMGDAVHRHPPSNGLGSNTSIQDAYNLAWKLAMVIKKQAAPKLLDSYNLERTPIAKQIVDRANKSISEFGPIFDALGLTSTKDVKQMKKNMQERKKNTAEAKAQREKLRQAVLYKSYEFNCHGVEMNQRYVSDAVINESGEEAFLRDKELYYQATTLPGAHLPHVWFGQDGHKVSSHDLAGKGRFSLFTGISGEAWETAATKVAKELGIELAVFIIGAGHTYTDLYGAWADQSEVDESGCILVRPDHYVAWRSQTLTSDPFNDLMTNLKQVLGL